MGKYVRSNQHDPSSFTLKFSLKQKRNLKIFIGVLAYHTVPFGKIKSKILSHGEE